MNTDIRSSLRTEIELTRQQFHRLLVTIPDAAVKLPSKDPAWTNGELLYRMSVASLVIRSTLKKNAAEHSDRLSIHQVVTGPLIQRTNEMFIRMHAQNSSRWSIAREYDETCTRVLEMLDTIPDDGFDQMLRISEFENDPLLPEMVTVEQLFHYARNHFDTYSQQLNLGQESE